MIRPLANNITAEPVEIEKKTQSGLFISQDVAEQMATKTAKVVAIGETVNLVKVGDEIVYKPYATFDFKHKDKTFVLVSEEDILGVVDGQ